MLFWTSHALIAVAATVKAAGAAVVETPRYVRWYRWAKTL